MSKIHFASTAGSGNAFAGSNYAEPGPMLLHAIGNVFYVSSVTGTDSTGYGFSPESPFATVNYAITQCVANNDDRIYVMPAHAESLSGAAAIAANIAGVSVIGMGQGSNRPTLTLHTAITTIAVSATNVTFKNIRIATDVDAVVKVFNITAAGCTLDAVDFVETASCACLQFVLTSAAGDDLTIQNCSWVQTQTAATATMLWIKLIGADRVKIKNNFCNLKGFATANPANGVIVGATTACNDVEIVGNRFLISNSTGNVPISLLTATTGFVVDNRVASGKTAIAGSIACASAFAAGNLAGHVVNTSGILEPAADT